MFFLRVSLAINVETLVRFVNVLFKPNNNVSFTSLLLFFFFLQLRESFVCKWAWLFTGLEFTLKLAGRSSHFEQVCEI